MFSNLLLSMIFSTNQILQLVFHHSQIEASYIKLNPCILDPISVSSRVQALQNCSTCYLYSILPITFSIMKLFLILSLYLSIAFLNLNVSKNPVSHKKLQKAFYGTVRFIVFVRLCLSIMGVRSYPRQKVSYQHCDFQYSDCLCFRATEKTMAL